LEADGQFWWFLWAPAVAVALHRTDHPAEAVALLTAAAAAGYRQPDLFGELLTETFAGDPGWPGLVAVLSGPLPPPPVEMLTRPDSGPMLPLVLDVQPGDRGGELAARLPAPVGSAWDTARATLTWAHRAWRHANAHVAVPDALAVVDRAAGGERFACAEYSIVLTQALNALAIPARRVSLYQDGHHQGLGRGHVVSEAWIDDLARWVLLTGRTGPGGPTPTAPPPQHPHPP